MKRTRSSIINAFIELRSKKELEKITVKELSELACINKATFYQHYRDIYDLSETLEMEVLSNAIHNMNHPEYIISRPREGVRAIANALLSSEPLLNILYSGNRHTLLVDRLEKLLKEIIYTKYPEYRESMEKDILITVLTQGTFRAYEEHKNGDQELLLDILGTINEKVIHAL